MKTPRPNNAIHRAQCWRLVQDLADVINAQQSLLKIEQLILRAKKIVDDTEKQYTELISKQEK